MPFLYQQEKSPHYGTEQGTRTGGKKSSIPQHSEPFLGGGFGLWYVYSQGRLRVSGAAE